MRSLIPRFGGPSRAYLSGCSARLPIPLLSKSRIRSSAGKQQSRVLWLLCSRSGGWFSCGRPWITHATPEISANVAGGLVSSMMQFLVQRDQEPTVTGGVDIYLGEVT
ncbi:hypothetical protein BO83DRAFT_375912 [Aspergillus eucalypticola CBS 122712]|uniref:Uncharacterized protein n=1 Tax=Aspergillus eucalypticola (strain CBS 122712 / IBT 29274) TaxID=1448314 RepID=A0A317W1U6_ASPEC|nr:uncharacterized protein BO83DRAFT_375912 [Aspergillus eucalypticola CBS 122712]PWY79965.1 hypothetical protein BO83DRAFT_375912 [Aspergillus eucalypticola CBS 122712]